jgi:hypothetical protein
VTHAIGSSFKCLKYALRTFWKLWWLPTQPIKVNLKIYYIKLSLKLFLTVYRYLNTDPHLSFLFIRSTDIWILPHTWVSCSYVQQISPTDGRSGMTFYVLSVVCRPNVTRYKKWVLVRFQVLTATSMKVTVFWDVAPRSLIEIDRHFRGAVRWFHHIGISSRFSPIYPNGTRKFLCLSTTKFTSPMWDHQLDCETSGSHGGENEYGCLLGCCAV